MPEKALGVRSLQACGKLSEGSGRTTNFYELDAQVKGMASLEQSLVGPTMSV